MSTINHRLFATESTRCVDNEDVSTFGNIWMGELNNPTRIVNLQLNSNAGDGTFLITARKLADAGWPVFDEPGVWPNGDDSRNFLGQMTQFYNIPHRDGFIFGTDEFWMFNEDNLNQMLDTGGSHPDWTPTNPTYPLDRVRTEFVWPRHTDFPSPVDYNQIIFSAQYRVFCRVKKCLTAARLCSFGQHGGRPRAR